MTKKNHKSGSQITNFKDCKKKFHDNYNFLYNEWGWSNSEFKEEPGESKVSYLIPDDPANFQWSSLFCPFPVSEYLTKADVTIRFMYFPF